MIEKFNVGDRVYDILRGLGTVVVINPETTLECNVVEVSFESRQFTETYSQNGFWDTYHKNPTLFTISAARARGYDVPKEKVKKTETQYCYVYTNGTISGQRFLSRKLAEECARGCATVATIAECVFTWEEEI